MFRSLFLAASVLGLAAPSPAAERWAFDKAHTQVLFTVDHLGFTELTGQFRVVEGELLLDREDLTRSSVRATIRADSVDMNDDRLNAHLRNADFFDVENHPALEFVSTAVERVGEDALKLHGELTMLGRALPVVLDVKINQIGSHPFRGTPYAGFTATGRLDRTAWGMGYLAGRIGTDIGIRINLEAAPVQE